MEDLISRINAALVWDQSGPAAVFLYGKACSACFGSCYHSSFMTHWVILSSSPVKEACNSFCTGSRRAGTRGGDEAQEAPHQMWTPEGDVCHQKGLPPLGHSPLGKITELRAGDGRWGFMKGLEHGK